MRSVWVVARKELRDAMRDRRALLSALFFPLFGPLLIALLLLGAASTTERTMRVGAVGLEQAPRLARVLQAHALDPVDVASPPRLVVEEGALPVVIRLGPTFRDTWDAQQPASLELFHDSSQVRSRVAMRTVHEALEQYREEIAHERLLGLGVHPSVLTPVQLDSVDMASPTDRAAHLLETLVMFIVVAAFICSMYIAIDTTAGERERHSLEPLLLNPVSTLSIVLGKFIATATVSALGLTLTTVFVFGITAQLPLEAVGFRLLSGPRIMAGLLLVLLPLSLIAAATQLLVASFATSFKEAQTHLSLTLFLPVAPSLALSMLPVQPATWMLLIPALGHQLLARAALRGEPIDALHIALCQGSTLLLTAACLWATALLFGRERVLFGD